MTTPNSEVARPSVELSVIILARNEAAIIARCIESVRWAAEVLVVDSESSDDTVAIARSLGARVIVQPWLGWSGQRNFGARSATFDWVMFLEADELVSEDLARSIHELDLPVQDPRDGFAVDRRNTFMGVRLAQPQRRSVVKTFVRIYNRRESSWNTEDLVHERVLISGRSRVLSGPLEHVREQSVQEWVERGVGYASLEEENRHRHGASFSTARLILLPIARFLWLYVAKRGFLRGSVGFIHASLKAGVDLQRESIAFERKQRFSLAKKQ